MFKPTFNHNEEAVIANQLLKECKVMAKYALGSGLMVSVKTLQAIDDFAKSRVGRIQINSAQTKQEPAQASLAQIAEAHADLVEVIKPTPPRTLLLFAARRSFFGFPDSIPLVEHLTWTAVTCIALFVTMSTLVHTDAIKLIVELGGSSVPQGWINYLATLFYYLAAAGLGASFSALFEVNRYIVDGTFDPKYVFSYTIRFVLGLIAGLTLAIVLGDKVDPQFTKALLAILGGYSSPVLERILNRFVEVLESVVRGKAKEPAAVPEQPVKAASAQPSKSVTTSEEPAKLPSTQPSQPGLIITPAPTSLNGQGNGALPVVSQS